MVTSKNLTTEIGRLLTEIQDRRNEIKEDYIKMWLASTIPIGAGDFEKVIGTLKLVEKWSDDRLSVSWYMTYKTEDDYEYEKEQALKGA